MDFRSHQPNHTTTILKSHRRSKSIMTRTSSLGALDTQITITTQLRRPKNMLFEIASAMGIWLFFFFLLFFDPLSSSWRYVSQPLTCSSSFFYLGILLTSSILFACPSIDTLFELARLFHFFLPFCSSISFHPNSLSFGLLLRS